MDGLADIRSRIEALDAELMDLIAERVAMAEAAGAAKQANGIGPRDFIVERTVVDRFRRGFDERGLGPDEGARIAHALFTETLRAQEDGARHHAGLAGTDVLVVGGAGRMGRWFARFLAGVGAGVEIYDTGGSVDGFTAVEDCREAAIRADAVLVSVPPAAVASVLDELTGIETPIIDIASLKGPFADELGSMASTQPVASVHPMWGPETRVLTDKYVLVCDCGSPEGTAMARRLVEPTLAEVIELPLDRHDEAMALTQVLPQLVGLATAEVLSTSRFTYEELLGRGGRSFAEQASLVHTLVERDPELYRQIQSLNADAPSVYDRLRTAIDRIEADREEPAAFADAFERYRLYFATQEEPRHP